MTGTPTARTLARLRPMTDADAPDVLALNAAHVEVLSPMDADRLRWLRGLAQRADVVEVRDDGTSTWVVAGFVLVVAPGTAYDSTKYRWFATRHRDFLYLDRVVIDERFHRRGLGTVVYEAVEGDAVSHGRLCLEVDVEPPNEESLAFHAARSYAEVARVGEPGAMVSMMVKELADDG